MATHSNISKLVLSIGVGIALVLSNPVHGRQIDGDREYCPKICTCDLVDGLKRADCSSENLISPHTEVPSSVEILDLSVNQISSVEDDDLALYIHLVKLFLSENAIQTVALNAFYRMAKLKVLDLSHNRLEFLDERLFEQNGKLVELHLSNNKFMMLPDKPFLISSSLMHLHLSECQMPQVFDSMFIHLPNLRTLDLSKNLMIGLSTAPFHYLLKLRTIDLFENRWKCDTKPVRSTITWLKKRVESIHVEKCLLNPLSKSANKFERLIEDPSSKVAQKERQDVDIAQVWSAEDNASSKDQTAKDWTSIMNQTCSFVDRRDDPSKKACELVFALQKQYNELYNAYLEALAGTGKTSAVYTRTVVLLSGIFIGILMGVFITYTVSWMMRSIRKARAASQRSTPGLWHPEMHREIRDRRKFEHSNLSQRQGEIYQSHENTRQFLVNLFSRRQPRFIRNNSQLHNIGNRHFPPMRIRDDLHSERARGELLRPVSVDTARHRENQDNVERERLLVNQGQRWSMDNTCSIRDVRQANDTPPPPYMECAVRMNSIS